MLLLLAARRAGPSFVAVSLFHLARAANNLNRMAFSLSAAIFCSTASYQRRIHTVSPPPCLPPPSDPLLPRFIINYIYCNGFPLKFISFEAVRIKPGRMNSHLTEQRTAHRGTRRHIQSIQHMHTTTDISSNFKNVH